MCVYVYIHRERQQWGRGDEYIRKGLLGAELRKRPGIDFKMMEMRRESIVGMGLWMLCMRAREKGEGHLFRRQCMEIFFGNNSGEVDRN